ncbi:MAG TPA: adenylate/guanylate cyclase domain-containing protein, partial [Spirochaetia bacterium]|nr:adenylate/guanylate cyclase domain-containing protein [Spirochaetia bacterium]
MKMPSGTVAFLFTDIEGSTKLWAKERELMSEDLQRHDTLLRAVIEGAEGYIFKTVGDAFCAAFSTCTAAISAVLELQRRMLETNWKVPNGLRVRAAVHVGEAVERDNDYFGPSVNKIARILSAGHGGQTLVSATVAELARESLPEGAALRALGMYRLKDLGEPQQIFQLDHEALRWSFPPLVTLDNRPNNLSPQPTRLIGREKELVDIQTALSAESTRLLTLTGPGGSGKTRLALQVGADLCDVFEHGVYFVDLSIVKQADLVTTSIAQVLDLRESMGQGGSTRQILKDFLREKDLLLILDNFEHLMGSAVEVHELLESTRRLKILVTTREALRLRDEHEYPIPPLNLPSPGRRQSIQRLSQYESVALFIERARSSRPDFAVTAENAPAIAEVCVRMDGLPLAIELAASRLRSLSVHDLLKMLSGRLLQMKGGYRDLPARQQTLRNAIDWSYDLLDPEEKQLFVRLAVFAGGCSPEAAESVCADEKHEVDTLDTMTSLVDKSLLKQNELAGESRYWMLETIREYASSRFMESSDAAQIGLRHAKHFLARAEDASAKLHGPDQMEWIARLETDDGNLVQAVHWFVTAGKCEEALRTVRALEWYWTRSGRFTEGKSLVEDTMLRCRSTEAAPLVADALKVHGWLLFLTGDWKRARAATEESIDTAQHTANRECEIGALMNLSVMERWTRDTANADRDADRSIALAKLSGEPFMVVRALTWAYAT